MSEERVHFIMDVERITTDVRNLFRTVFKDELPYPSSLNPNVAPVVTVICRLDQFARFLIMRNDLGLKNGFKELNPKIVPATDKYTLNVSSL